jgi:hypothetical protein
MANHSTARLTLLIHMLCNLGGSDVSARTLKEIADRKMDRTSKSVVLDEIMKVRMLQERYERGEVGMYSLLSSSRTSTDGMQTQRRLSMSARMQPRSRTGTRTWMMMRQRWKPKRPPAG